MRTQLSISLKTYFLGLDFFELSPSEKEYYQLATTVKSLLPIYLNNEYGFTDESVGFFDSFFGSMYKTAFKNTAPASDAGGLFVSTDIVGEKEKLLAYENRLVKRV